MNLLICTIILGLGFCFGVDVPIQINLTKPAAVVDNQFLSLTFDSSVLKNHLKRLNLKSKKLLALAKGLSGNENRPEFYLRIGGGDADHISFDPTKYVFNVTDFDEICQFVYTLRWELIFDLNLLLRKEDGAWNPANAIELIDYAINKGYYVHYELGNEPDLYPRHLNITIPPKQLANDFKTLRNILNQKTRNQAMLVGPDVATLTRYNYFANVLSNMEKDVLDAVTFHHYYSSSDNITCANFTSVKYLDSFLDYGLKALGIIEASFSSFPHPPVWIGETSSTYGGGSDIGESYVAGFVWLDKLGLAAQLNIAVVMRQCLKGGKYSLLNENLDPNPDYWSTLLYKQLVGRTVLDVTGFLTHGRDVRVYAHCVNRFSGRGYKKSSIVLIVLNVNAKDSANIYLQKELSKLDADQYLFSPANGKLEDRNVLLNGKLLKLVNETIVPALNPVRVQPPYEIPPLTYGYFVVIGSYAPACDQVNDQVN